MGSFGAGFLESVGNGVAKKADEEHQQEMQRKKLLGDSYLRAISQIGNPDGSPLTDQQKQQISTYQDEYDKLYGKSKGMKDALQKVRHITAVAMGHPSWGGQSQAQPATPPAAAAPKAGPGIPPPPGAAPVDPDKQIVSGKAAAAASDRADSPYVQPNWTPPPSVQAPTPGGDQKKNDVASTPSPDAVASTPTKTDSAPSAPATKPTDTPASPDSPTATADAKAANTPVPSGAASSTEGSGTPSSDALLKSITRGGVLPPPPLPPAPAPLPPPNFAPAVPPPPGHPPNIEPWVEAYRLANPSLDEQNSRAFQQQERIRAMEAKYKIQELEAQAKAQAAKPSNARAVEGHPVGQTEAQDMLRLGQVFPDIDGNPIDPSLVKPGTELIPVYLGGGKMYWRLGSQTGRIVNVANTTFGEGTQDLAHGLPGATAMGPRNANRSSSHEVRGAQGAKDTLHNTTTYAPSVAPGTVVGGGEAPSGTLPPNSTVPPPQHSTPNSHRFATGQPMTDSEGKIPEPPSGRQPKASAASVPPPPRENASSGAKLHLTPAEYNQERQIVTPVREAVTQIFGDPSSGLEGLTKYGKLYNDPEARRRVANAIALTFGADPESADKEGLFSIVKNYSGIPLNLAASQVDAKNQALRQLSGPESDWYNALVGAYGAAVGLRSLTKASGAQASVRRIEQELPLPDMYTNSSRAFYDRMSKLAEMVYNGTRTLSDQGPMGREEKERYHGLVKQMLDRKKAAEDGGTSNTAKKTLPPPPGSATPIRTAAELLQKYQR